MTWLSRLVAAFLVAAISVAVISTVFDHTVFNSKYLEQKAAQNNAYSRLSVALSEQVSKDSGASSNPQLDTALQKILTPAVLQTKINSALDQMQAYYKGNGPPPTIDLSDLSAQATAAGLPIPADSQLNKPITISKNDQAKGIGKKFEGVKVESLIAIALALVLLIFLSWERNRYAILPDIAIICGLLIGLDALIFATLPGVIDKYVKLDFNSSAFGALGHDMLDAIARDLGKTFGLIAVTFLIVGIVGRILVGILQKPKTPAAKPAAKSVSRPKTATTSAK